MNELTPLMSQYREIKSEYNDCVLLFRVGDFYETFFEDAVEVSSLLNIALTTRDKNKANPIPLAGVPFHAAENYITRLLSLGKKVAVCEQVEDPAVAKGLVKREVVEVLTPGTALNSQLLESAESNYCLSLYVKGTRAALALADVSTGDFFCGEENLELVHHLIQGKRVRELVCQQSIDRRVLQSLAGLFGRPFVTELPDERFDIGAANAALERQFPDGTGGAGDLSPMEVSAAGALLSHCQRLGEGRMPQLVKVDRMDGASFLTLDDETIANLELFEPLRGGFEKATVIRTIDRTKTPMGGREIRRWLQKPLNDVSAVDERLSAVGELYGDDQRAEATTRSVKNIGDIHRLSARIAAKKAVPREFHALRESLEKIPSLCGALSDVRSTYLQGAVAGLGDFSDLCETIQRAIVEDPPGHLRDGGVIRRGFDGELDELLEASENTKRWIADLESRERDRTGIGSLKVGYNKVFGYYIEVSRANAKSVPEDYIAKQTLVSSQRYYTKELKDKEHFILETEERRIECEQRVYDRLCESTAAQISRLQRAAGSIGRIDAILSLATVARLHGYKRPVVDDSLVIDVADGRHVVLEQFISEPFVPNDLFLDPDKKQFALITGPNMSGKSTYLRQTALIVLLAQMGSFVPAEKARIGLVDRIFTRVGASDRLSRGESTFLVEMNETANILENMTSRSLVILDEIGRGTSTYDGLSIAWAVTEYVLEGIKARPRTLFATHFHELTQLQSVYPRLVNLKITIREWESGIIFLRKIVPGTSDRSFGIHAAKVAGLPPLVLKRAGEILESLELRRNLLSKGLDLRDMKNQYSLFAAGTPDSARSAVSKDGSPTERPALEPLREALAAFDPDNSTPLEALKFVKELKERADR